MSRPTLALIAAVAKNLTIGKDGGMPWHIPADLAYFRGVTRGHSVIMGRRTWESLGKALPHRRNIVVTSNRAAVFPGAEAVGSMNEALALCEGEEKVFCIGGAVLYKEALPYADLLYLTEIQESIEGDTLFPVVDWADWRVEYKNPQTQVEAPERFDFVLYARKSAR
jgi:dihydrofolate reductase